jgi:tetratricopeptide (TPR) repeat protein
MEKQWQKAVNFCTEAIKLNGKMATYYSNRAAAFLELARYQFLQSSGDLYVKLSFGTLLLFDVLPFGPFSYRQAEADFRSAMDLDPKV